MSAAHSSLPEQPKRQLERLEGLCAHRPVITIHGELLPEVAAVAADLKRPDDACYRAPRRVAVLPRSPRPLTTITGAFALAMFTLACSGKETKPAVTPGAGVENGADVDEEIDPALAARMERLGARIDAKRQELGIPGLGLVVVKDGVVVLSSGFGQRDVAAGLPVDEDTLFAIGSTTKAFTATLIMMAVDEGLISLDDPPRKCVPYFKLKDEETDAKMTVRDLLTHSSGLMRTDLGWYSGKLSTEETIRVAGLAEPTAKLRERFQYQNVMYAAAGVCAENLFQKPYPQLLQEKIFTPLGMTHGTNVSVAANLELEARAVGYTKAGPEETLTPVPMRPIDNVAGAGAINSSLRDITPWLFFNLAGGEYGGERQLSRSSYKELTKRQQKITAAQHYGLGWIRDHWRTHQRLSHTGGIDGFVTLISMLPKEGVAFALFTNIQNGHIHGFVTEEVYGALFDESWGTEPEGGVAEGLPPGAEKEAGRYGVVGGMSIEITMENGKLVAHAPRQPSFELIHLDERKYRLGPPAPSGLYMTFRPKEGDPERRELAVETPQGTQVLSELRDEDIAAAKSAPISDELRELLGVYGVDGESSELEIGLSEGRVALIVPGQDPKPLVARDRDIFSLDGLPEGFSLEVVREDAAAKGKSSGDKGVRGLKLNQPTLTLALTLKAKRPLPKITVEKLYNKMRKAAGSKAQGKHSSIQVTATQTFVNQGLTAKRTTYQGKSNTLHEVVAIQAFERVLGTITTSFDGERADQHISFTEGQPLNPQQSAMIRVQALYDPLADHPEVFGPPVIARAGAVGEEPTVVLKVPIKTGGEITLHVSTQTWRVVQQDMLAPVNKEGAQQNTTTRLEDYRLIKGVSVPHRITTDGPWGEIVDTVERVDFDLPWPGK